ncbi:MAG: hypothetical protein OEW11_02570 [Nitrospirota bacterium]|nr:hypothetical protein [Nitrospirota bacterium]
MLSDRFVRLSVLYALLGMALGIYMAISHRHVQMPTHAHLNLLGYVSMMMYSLFYKAYPHAETGKLPIIHFWLSNLSAVGLTIGVGLIYGGMPEAEPIAAASSMTAIFAMALFAVVVFRATRTAA